MTPTGPVLPAWAAFETDGVYADIEKFGGGTPADGEHVSSWQSTGTNTFIFSDGEESDPGAISPNYFTTGAVNGHPVVIFDDVALGFGNPGFGDGSGEPSSWTFHFLIDQATPGGVRGTLLLDTDGPSFECYCDRAGQVGFSNNGSDHDIAAAASGVQVLTWWVDGPAQELKLYRNGVQIGMTQTDVPADGWALPGQLYFAFNGANVNTIPAGTKFVAWWGYHEAQSAQDLADQVAYLMDRGGI